MEQLKDAIGALPLVLVGQAEYLSYRAVTDLTAAFLFPDISLDQLDESAYRRILETADRICRELGYTAVGKLSPPDVPFKEMGLYWVGGGTSIVEEDDCEEKMIVTGPGQVEELEGGRLVDARLSRHGLDDVIRQHFKIPVTVSDGVYGLISRAVEGPWPNDWKGVMHDILGMCIAGGKDTGPNERAFTVIIRGVGRRRYWQMKALLKVGQVGSPYLLVMLADEQDEEQLFELGQVVMTAGVAALGVDLAPFLARHRAGDWGSSLDEFDRRQNDIAVKEGLRILSAYNVPTGKGTTERIWIITEADRRTTTALLPAEY